MLDQSRRLRTVLPPFGFHPAVMVANMLQLDFSVLGSPLVGYARLKPGFRH